MSKPFDNYGMAMMLQDWMSAKQALDQAKEYEKDLRIEICETLLDGESAGSHKFPIENIQATATKVVNYSLDQDAVEQLINSGEIEDYEFACIRVKYSLDIREYKQIPDHLSTGRLDDMITVKEGMPQLKVST